MDPKQPANASLEWRDDGTPVSTAFDDPYYSVHNGLAETRHVFLKGNNLPERFVDGFHIGELGFGSGLNLLAAWAAWRASGTQGSLHFTSFEAFPMHPDDMTRALQNWPELTPLAEQLLKAGGRSFTTSDLDFQLVTGPAIQTLPNWQGKADAWFLDGFSPAKNPDMWTPALMAQVGAHTATNGSFATYTAAGHVRRSLGSAGFEVQRVAGHGRKRHMSIGLLR